MTTQQQQIVDNCKAVFAKAKEFWPHLNFDHVGIRFDLTGRCAGMAHRRGGTYFMRFNRDMLTREAFDHVLNDTVPHEIAHIVCFMDPHLGSNHNHGWMNVCRRLGGTGARCHREEVVYGKGITYEYTTTKGHQVRVSQSIHTKMHTRNSTYTYKGNKGAINKNCAHQVVGVQGRTLAEPVRKVEAKTPVVAPIVATTPVFLPLDQFHLVNRIDTRTPPAAPVQHVTRPVAPVAKPLATFASGTSKAAIARAIMLSGYQAGHEYETIISAIMVATGHDRQLARATYKANAHKVGIPL